MIIGGPLFNVFKNFSTNWKQCSYFYGRFSQFKLVVCGVPWALSIYFIHCIYNNLEDKIVCYADNTTYYSEIYTLSDCVKGAKSLNRDLLRIQTWCSTWGMKLNQNKTHSIIISRSRTALPQHLPLFLCGFKLETSTFLS